MMKQNVKISVIVPAFRAADYLAEAIDSALAQTYPNVEVIVVNDGSDDGGETERIALSYGDRIRYIKKENGGVSSALNAGIRAMTGDYFSWLSHDDLYAPDKLSELVGLLMGAERLGTDTIACCAHDYADQNGRIIGERVLALESGKVYTGTEMLRYSLQNGRLYGCSMLIPRKAFEEVGFFDETLRFSQDALMWDRLFLAGYSLVYSRKKCTVLRIHPAQVSNTRRELFERDSAVIARSLIDAFKAKAPELLPLYARRMARHHCREAVRIIEAGGGFSLPERVKLIPDHVFGLGREAAVTLLGPNYRYLITSRKRCS